MIDGNRKERLNHAESNAKKRKSSIKLGGKTERSIIGTLSTSARQEGGGSLLRE